MWAALCKPAQQPERAAALNRACERAQLRRASRAAKRCRPWRPPWPIGRAVPVSLGADQAASLMGRSQGQAGCPAAMPWSLTLRRRAGGWAAVAPSKPGPSLEERVGSKALESPGLRRWPVQWLAQALEEQLTQGRLTQALRAGVPWSGHSLLMDWRTDQGQAQLYTTSSCWARRRDCRRTPRSCLLPRLLLCGRAAPSRADAGRCAALMGRARHAGCSSVSCPRAPPGHSSAQPGPNNYEAAPEQQVGPALRRGLQRAAPLLCHAGRGQASRTGRGLGLTWSCLWQEGVRVLVGAVGLSDRTQIDPLGCLPLSPGCCPGVPAPSRQAAMAGSTTWCC